MQHVDEMLAARVDDVAPRPTIRPPVLFTTGTQAAIDSLTERMAVVEEAIECAGRGGSRLARLPRACAATSTFV